MTQKSKLIFTTIVILFISSSVFSQNCNLKIKDGSKITLNAQSWANPLLYDAKFEKAKDEQKTAQIVAYNESIATGKTPAASNYPMTFTAKKTTLSDGVDEYQMTTNISGKDYSSYVICRDDSLFISRNRGILTTPD